MRQGSLIAAQVALLSLCGTSDLRRSAAAAGTQACRVEQSSMHRTAAVLALALALALPLPHLTSAQGYGQVVQQRSSNNNVRTTTRTTNTGATSGGSGGWGDPMFRGLDGRAFYFDGVVGKIFNIITEQDHQLNAEFGLGPHKIDALGRKTDGTFMTAFGLQIYGNKIEAHANEEGEMTVSINGQPTESYLNETSNFEYIYRGENGVSITVEKYRPHMGHTVTARSPLLELFMYPTLKEFDPVIKEIARGHLNFELSINPSILALTNMHGVLGQNTITRSTDTALIADQLATLFLGEGEDEDYIVSDLFGSDFKYNEFGISEFISAGSQPTNSKQSNDATMQRSSMHMSATRRFLKEGAAPFYVPVAKLQGLL